ncbi:MAG: SpoIID/LytB domain-containing protein [Acidobacteriota bacterium]
MKSFRTVCFSATLCFVVAACSTTTPSPSNPMPEEGHSTSRSLQWNAQSTRTIPEPTIRVGLSSDQDRASFPRIEGGYLIRSDAGSASMMRGFSVEAPLAGATTQYAVQVVTITDKESTAASAERLRAQISDRVDIVPGAANYRIIAGSFPTEEAARPLRQQLADLGYPSDMFIIKRPSEQPFKKAMMLVDDEGNHQTIEGQSLLVLPASKDTVTIGEKAYRGGARLTANSRGLINVINELNLEDYVRGVIPNEMGSKVYDELEALKAQALAARTYAVNRMGDFRSEGYDICSTPACQVYGGFSTEEEMSNEAVKQTQGLVITYGGKPIDALFTSTCGGETSDVGVMFPGRNEPYLKAVRDVELDLQKLNGRQNSGLLSQTEMHSHIFAAMAGLRPGSSWSASDVAEVVRAASALAGVPIDGVAAPRSSRRGDVLSYLSDVWGLADKSNVLVLPESRTYYFPQSPNDGAAYAAAAFLVKFGIVPSQNIDKIDLSVAMPRDELGALMYSWLKEHEAISETAGKIHGVEGRAVSLKVAGKTSSFSLPAGIPMMREMQERYQEYASLPFLVGDRATIIQRQGAPVALIVQANYDGASFDRTSSFANWTRSYRSDDLVKSIARRTPLKSLKELTILSTDPSHRVKELRVVPVSGEPFVLKGLPIRWSLNVPDNLFVFTKSTDPDGMERYTFFGKGWGHGVGMCQVGAYGMALIGRKADEIIKHYYSGVEIVPLSSLTTATAAPGS